MKATNLTRYCFIYQYSYVAMYLAELAIKASGLNDYSDVIISNYQHTCLLIHVTSNDWLVSCTCHDIRNIEQLVYKFLTTNS